MAGKAGSGKKAVQTIINRKFNGDVEAYNEWRKQIGSKGGKNGKGIGYKGGFAHPNANPSEAGKKGGEARRGK